MTNSGHIRYFNFLAWLWAFQWLHVLALILHGVGLVTIVLYFMGHCARLVHVAKYILAVCFIFPGTIEHLLSVFDYIQSFIVFKSVFSLIINYTFMLPRNDGSLCVPVSAQLSSTWHRCSSSGS